MEEGLVYHVVDHVGNRCAYIRRSEFASCLRDNIQPKLPNSCDVPLKGHLPKVTCAKLKSKSKLLDQSIMW